MYFTVLAARAPHRFLATVAWVFLIAAAPITAASPVIIDHTSVDQYQQIPDCWIEQVKNERMVAHYLGGSHARQMHNGLVLLEAQNPKYSADVNGNPGLFADENSLRDLRGRYTSQYNSWSDSGGADHYWRDDTAKQTLVSTIGQANTVLGYPVAVSLYGWSYHMCNPSYSTNELGHPFSDADLQNYLNAIAEFNGNSSINATKFAYHTSVTDCNTTYGPGMNRWNQMIRDEAAAKGGILFDQADIENWNNSNTSRYVVNNTIYLRHPDYAESVPPDTYPPGSLNTDHTNDALDIRKAKALWVLLARIAGWDGLSLGDFDLNCVVDSADFAGMPSCLTGPGGLCSEDCRVFDFDGDSDVDLEDVAEFLLAASMAAP